MFIEYTTLYLTIYTLSTSLPQGVSYSKCIHCPFIIHLELFEHNNKIATSEEYCSLVTASVLISVTQFHFSNRN